MRKNPIEDLPKELRNMILQVLEVNQYDPTAITAYWVRETSLQEIKGVLAVVEFHPNVQIAVLNLPVVVMPVYGKILTIGDVLQLLTIISEIPSAQFALKDNILFFTFCKPLHSFSPEIVPAIFDRLTEGTKELRDNLLAAVLHYYQIQPPEEWTYPKPSLPNIKMTPKEMQIIYNVLSRCKPNAQEVYIHLMENWDRTGYIVSTTPSTIVLDAPYGDRTARLAVLLPGTSEGLAALQPLGYAKSPTIALIWEGLRRYQGLPAVAVDNYQKVVSKIASLHITEASAHLEINEQFEITSAKALLKAMKVLAKSVRPELAEAPAVSAAVTPNNIQKTLVSCTEHVQVIYRELIEAWSAAGGIIQCPRPGRIYLKMVTKAHRSGKFAQLKRRFNLIVLAAPRGKKPSNIEVTWGLSDSESAAYLDCIAGDVAQFEATIASFPNFERKGTITYLWMDENFRLDHARVLGDLMITLRKAEQATI